jgi:site-specific DNA-methyltransferase (adenine-specific)
LSGLFTRRDLDTMTHLPYNSLIEGDCLTVMPYFAPHSVDLILSDLPYILTRNTWDTIIPLDRLWREYRRILKPTGAVVLTSCQPFTSQLVMSNPRWFRYELIWTKNKASDFLNARRKPLRIHENILVFSPRQTVYHPQMGEGTPYVRWNTQTAVNAQTNYGAHRANVARSSGARYPTTVMPFDRVPRPIHPTEKPLTMGMYLVRTYSNPGDLVLDNAFGSGAFLEAAVRCGRNVLGIELNRELQSKRGPIDQIAYAHDRLMGALLAAEAAGLGEHLLREGLFAPRPEGADDVD